MGSLPWITVVAHAGSLVLLIADKLDPKELSGGSPSRVVDLALVAFGPADSEVWIGPPLDLAAPREPRPRDAPRGAMMVAYKAASISLATLGKNKETEAER